MLNEEESTNEAKTGLLLKEFSEYGYNKTNKISQNEILLFLDLRSPEKKFDPILTEKLLNNINIDPKKIISIEEFIQKFIKFDEDIKKEAKKMNSQYMNKKEIYKKILDNCEKYKSEKINEEGFCQEAKLIGEIFDMILTTKLVDIQEIILKIIYSGQEVEISKPFIYFRNNEKDVILKKFKFKAYTKKDNIIFKLQGKNEFGSIINLGEKEYSLLELENQDDIFLKIEIPEEGNENEGNIISEINAKIALKWSYFEYYDLKRKIIAQELIQLKNDLNEIIEYIRKIERIYGDNYKSQDFINIEECLDPNKITDSILLKNNNKNNNLFPLGKYIVQFNSVRVDKSKNKGKNIVFNNKKIIFPMKERQYLSKNEEQNEEQEFEDEEIIENEDNMEIIENDKIHQKEENNYNFKSNENLINNEKKEMLERYEEKGERIEEIVDNEEGPKDENENELLNSEDEPKDKNEIEAENNILFNNKKKNSLNCNENKNNKKNKIINFNKNNIRQLSPYVKKPLISKSTNNIFHQKITLPIKYLPIKITKSIVDNNIITLPVIHSTKNIKYNPSKDNNDINNILGCSQINKYNSLVNNSYQTLTYNNNKHLGVSNHISMKRNNSITAFY